MRNLLLVIVSAITACSQPNQNFNSETEVTSNTVVTTAYSDEAAGTSKGAKDASNCEYDNLTRTLGIGLVAVPSTFELFSDSLLANRYLQWDMYSSESPPKPACSKYYNPEYAIMQFVCIDKTEKYYKVLSGYDQVFFLPVSEGYEFEAWQNYILNSFGVRRSTELDNNWKDQPLRKLPNESSEELKFPEGLEMFCAMEMKGEWLKVKYDCFYNTETELEEGTTCHQYIDKCTNIVTGWLKWKDDNKVLIDIMTMP